MGLDWTRTRLSRLVRLAVAGNTPARANTDMDWTGLGHDAMLNETFLDDDDVWHLLFAFGWTWGLS